MMDPPEPFPSYPQDRGPDPVWAVGLFIVGLLIMAMGGAATWHWVFITGTGLLLAGATLFLLSLVRVWFKQR